MGFDDGPNLLPLSYFGPFRDEAQPGSNSKFAPDPFSQLIVCFRSSRLSIGPLDLNQA